MPLIGRDLGSGQGTGRWAQQRNESGSAKTTGSEDGYAAEHHLHQHRHQHHHLISIITSSASSPHQHHHLISIITAITTTIVTTAWAHLATLMHKHHFVWTTAFHFFFLGEQRWKLEN